MNYVMSLMSYPCFGTVLALRDVFLHLVYLQLMREIPDQQLLWMRYRERDPDGLSDRQIFLFSFTFIFFTQSFSVLSPQTLADSGCLRGRGKTCCIKTNQPLSYFYPACWVGHTTYPSMLVCCHRLCCTLRDN